MTPILAAINLNYPFISAATPKFMPAPPLLTATKIRPADTKHIPDIAKLEQSYYPDDCYGEGFLYQALSQWPQGIWVAEQGGQLLGYALLAPGQHQGEHWLMAAVVNSKGRGQGIGKKLCLACIASARKQGCSSLYLTVAEDNDVARNLYLKLGFQAQALKQDFFGPGQHRVLMHLAL